MIAKLKRLYRFLFRNPPKFRIVRKLNFEKHGTDYGGWTIVKDSLNPSSIVYSFGVGMDISFDVSIIERYGCKVHAFDPTPRVAEWLKTQNISKLFNFHPIGLSDQNSEITFYLPLNPSDISHAAIDTGSSETISVPANRLDTILKNLNHDYIDVLKMDIEGFEYVVIPDLILSNIRPKQLLVEFHHVMKGYKNSDTEKIIEQLKNYNYELFHVSDTFSEFAFIDKQL
jgi:FkbM family methyltransferase